VLPEHEPPEGWQEPPPTQAPPTQDREQQSPAAAQGAPEPLQEGAQAPWSQVSPAQHGWEGPHAPPKEVQAAPPAQARLLSHRPEQQSEPTVQVCPETWHSSSPHTPRVHTPLQQDSS
jgi:hypothetical protein